MSNTEHPGPEDLPYLRSNFVPLNTLARAYGHDADGVRRAIADQQAPGIPYVLDDGTELVAPDYFALAHLAGGFHALQGWFIAAYDQAAARVVARYPDTGTGEEQWPEYLTGIYAVCLRMVTPESILAKGELMDTIARLTDDPQPEQPAWRRELTAAVDALDVLERPFALFDRERFGPVSRDRCVTAVRERFDLERSPQPVAL